MLSDFLWSLVVFFFMVIYFMLLFGIISDLFRQKEMSGFVKALWMLAILFIPVFSMLMYVIIYGRSMAERSQQAAARVQEQQADYIRRTVASGSSGNTATDQIAQAQSLLNSGAITPAEFEALKAKALA